MQVDRWPDYCGYHATQDRVPCSRLQMKVRKPRWGVGTISRDGSDRLTWCLTSGDQVGRGSAKLDVIDPDLEVKRPPREARRSCGNSGNETGVSMALVAGKM